MDPEEDLDQDQSDTQPEPEDNSNQQSSKSSSNPRSDNYSGEGGQNQSRRERKRELKSEAKDRKKESGKEQKLDKKDKDDPLNQKHKNENKVGHIPGVGGYAKAHEQSKTGEKREAGKTLVKQQIKRKIRKAVVAGVKKVAVRALANPYVIGAIIVLLVFFLIIFAMGDPAEGDPRPKLTITKSGPTTANINDELPYQITVSYPAQAVDIVITDRIPEGTEYVDSSPSAKFDPATKIATWNLKDYQNPPGTILNNINATLSIKLRAIADDLVLVNQAEGNVTPFIPPPTSGGGPINGDIAKLLPNPLPPDVEGTQGEKTAALDAISANRAVYERVAAATGVPWQVFAGIHYREGNADPQHSIVSGRIIGANEPDVTEGPGCSVSAPIGAEDGQPEVSGSQCVFSSLADSGIYAGNLLKRKVPGDINNFESLVEALSNYNGGGNSNCDKTPYKGCPRHFYGEDDTYVMNLFDNRHVPMYVVYCGDGTKCNPPVEDGRPGTATTIKWVAQGAK